MFLFHFLFSVLFYSITYDSYYNLAIKRTAQCSNHMYLFIYLFAVRHTLCINQEMFFFIFNYLFYLMYYFTFCIIFNHH